MRFHAEHRFQGTPDAVAAVLGDPAFYADLDLPDVSRPVLLEKRTDRSRTTLRLRYDFVGHLDGQARRLLGANRLSWTQDVEVDPAAGAGRLTFRAEADPKRLHGSADFVLEGAGNGTVRRLQGDVIVAVPLIGSWAEGRITPGVLRRLDIEARALDERLGGST